MAASLPVVSLLLIGAVAGFSSGLLGIGGGVIYVPALLFVLGCSIHTAIGISLAVIVPTALVAVLKHGATENIDLTVALIVTAGGVVGALAGASLAHAVPALLLKRIFGVFLLLLGMNFLLGWSDAYVKKLHGARVPSEEKSFQDV